MITSIVGIGKVLEVVLKRKLTLGQGQRLFFVQSGRSVMQKTYGFSCRLLSRGRRENRLRFDRRFGLSVLDVVTQ